MLIAQSLQCIHSRMKPKAQGLDPSPVLLSMPTAVPQRNLNPRALTPKPRTVSPSSS